MRLKFDVVRALALAAVLVSPWPTSSREAHWPESLTIGTGSAGGTYYVYGEGLARLLTHQLDLPVVMRPTEGPSQNILLLETGEIQIGFVTQGVALQAWNSGGVATGGRPVRAMRAMFPMYDTPFQFVALQNTGVQSLTDLGGRRVGLGPEGGTGAIYAPRLFRTWAIDAQLVHGDWNDLAAQLIEGKIDALAVAAGVPFPAMADIERSTKIQYIPVAQSQILAARLEIPELGPSLVAAGSYPSLREHYPTVGLFNFAVVRSDLPDDLVYAIVEAVFANHNRLIEIHPAAVETVPTNFIRNSFMPFHNGAARWYHNNAVTGIVSGD